MVVPSRCGGSRAAAAADADLAVITVHPGPGFLSRLREAVLLAPQAKAFLVYEGADPQSPSALPAGAARGYAIAVSVIPITDTVKEVADGLVVRTVPRDTLVDARGPWMLDRDAVTAALDRAALAPQAETFVDLCRISGMRVQVVLAK